MRRVLQLVLLLLLASPAWATIAFDSTAGHSAANGTTSLGSAGVVVTVTIVSGQLVHVTAGNATANLTVASVTDDGSNGYTKQTSQNNGAEAVEIWTSTAGASATTVTVKWNSPSGSAEVGVIQYTGVAALGVTATGTGTTSVTLTTQDNNNFNAAGFFHRGSAATSITTGTSRLTGSTGSGGSKVSIAIGDNTSATPASVTVATSSTDMAGGVELRSTSGGVACTPTLTLLGVGRCG